MGAIVTILSRFGPARLAAMAAVTLTLIGFFAVVILRVSQPAMGVLFSELSAADAGAIMKELDSRGVRYESRDEGATILAPRADVPRLRMDLATKSLPSGGGVGYEIFDKGDAFSSTSFVQNINGLRALEGELARTIRTIGRVQAARVHLALPERRLFDRDREPPRASIVLRTRGELGAEQVQAIRHLVASAVQGLTAERVSIVDERGKLLAGGPGQDGQGAAALAGDDRRATLERRLRQQVEEIMAGIVGPGRARVQVAAELDLNRVESRSENYDPESRVLRSSQTRGETSSTAGGEGQVSVGNELPGAKDANAQPAARDQSSKTEEVSNYEISRTTRTEIVEAGRVKRLSVAVLVDGNYTKGPNGEAVYQPRSKEDLDRIGALVRTAIGFDKGRGDQVEVVNLPLAETPSALPSEPTSFLGSLLTFSREDLVRLMELGVISLLTLIVLMVVVRPMVRKVIAPDGPLALSGLTLPGGMVAALGGQGGGEAVMAQVGAAGPAGALAAGPPQAAIGTAAPPPGATAGGAGAETGIPAAAGTPPAGGAGADLGLSGSAQAAAEQLARLGDLARSNPKEAASVLRGWMSER